MVAGRGGTKRDPKMDPAADLRQRVKKGLEAGRAKQAEARYQSALLKAVQDAVAIEKPTFATPEEIANDEYVRYNKDPKRRLQRGGWHQG